MGHSATAFERYLDVALFLLIVTGFLTVAVTGKLDAGSLVLVSAALAYRAYQLLSGRVLLLPERWTNVLTAGYVAFYIADVFLFSLSFVAATVHLVLFASVVKIFSLQRDRDRLYLAVLSFAAVLGAAVWTVDSLFLMAFCLFLLLATATFILFEMKRSAATAGNQAKEPSGPPSRFTRSLSATAAGLALATTLGAAILFFILPRLSAGYLSAYAPRNDLVSGFSDDVRLGQIGEIQQSDSVVMHIEVKGDTLGAFDLKWRGVALSLFDGHRWSRPADKGVMLRNAADGTFDLAAVRQALGGSPPVRPRRPVHYRVMMEPLAPNIFFLAPVPHMLFGNYRLISIDEAGAVANGDRSNVITAYEAVSDIAEPRADTLRAAAADIPPEIAIRYLQLPKLDRRVPGLAQQVTGRAGSAYDKAVAMERHVRAFYAYTLELGGTRPADPLANFLFERKAGHCEYFASAMAVMLRTQGIPTRVVNGFRGGEYNPLTGSYIIRARDAHSWVEAYFPAAGWVSFDPTPPSPAPPTSLWRQLALYADAAREFWREWVINYDFAHQTAVSASATTRSRQVFEDGRAWWRRHYRALLNRAHGVQRQAQESPWRYAAVCMGLVAGIALLLNAGRLWRGWRGLRLAARPERAPQAAAAIWYQRMTHSLARRGLRKQVEQTPGEFLQTIEEPGLRHRVAAFTRHYECARFGQSAADAGKLPELYREIEIGGSRGKQS